MTQAAVFAASAVALYAAHHVGDYWIQTDHQARTKGGQGKQATEGCLTCMTHVATYLLTQLALLTLTFWVLGLNTSTVWNIPAGILVSGVTHYIADRRAPLARIAGWFPGKTNFWRLGAPREGVLVEAWSDCDTCAGSGTAADESTGGRCWDCKGGGKLPHQVGDNPSLGTGAWALDQSWHIFWGVFVAALIIAA